MSSKAKRPTIAGRFITVKDAFAMARAWEKKISEIDAKIRELEDTIKRAKCRCSSHSADAKTD